MKKIRWGVIGCGGIADKRTIAGMLLCDRAECVAVMDRKFETAARVREKYNIPNMYTDEKELLAQTDVDAVYIATPVFCHKANVFAAADAGKHILLEKPMGLTVEEAREMAAYCKAKNVKLGIGFMMRFHAAHCKIKELLETGAIGEIVSAYAKFNCRSPVSPVKWRQTKAFGGGGAMMDMGIHCIDLLQHLSGMRAKEVVAMTGNQIFSYPDTEDAATAVLRMENGAMFTVEANFNIPDTIGGCRFIIYGTKGCIEARGTIGQVEEGQAVMVRETTDGVVTEAIEYAAGNMYTKEIDSFSRALSENADIPVTAEQAIFNQSIVEAVYTSQQQGSRITPD